PEPPRLATFAQSSSSLSSLTCGTTKAARTGGGIGASGPRTDRQTTSLRSRSSAWSSLLRSNFSDSLAPQALNLFFALRSVSGTRCLYGRRSGSGWNEAYIGRAAASNWLMGRRPRLNSIVRNMLVVEYSDET